MLNKHDNDEAVSSTKLVPVKSIINKNLILLTDGTYRMILKVHPVNFDLKSDRDKLRIIIAFGTLLNALTTDTPIQFLLHSKRLETETYINMYNQRLLDPHVSPQLKEFIMDHIKYFQETAMRHNLLQREFFVVVPYNPDKVENLAQGDGISEGAVFQGLVTNFFKKDAGDEDDNQPKSKLEADTALRQLGMRVGTIQSHLGALGAHSEVLTERDIIALFYELFNPGAGEAQKIRTVNTGPTSILSGPRTLQGANNQELKNDRSLGGGN